MDNFFFIYVHCNVLELTLWHIVNKCIQFLHFLGHHTYIHGYVPTSHGSDWTESSSQDRITLMLLLYSCQVKIVKYLCG